jgi:flagellar hook protein FlgE
MSLTASMWTGVSGLKGHGQKMGVIGNNIANVSTVGFKGSRMHFEDFMSQRVSTAAGVGQVGRGVSVGTILGDFSQGALETTNESTDVAITGNGFFTVSPAGEEINYYTRAGNFRFDKDGYLIDPHGYRVQGWEIEKTGVDDLVGQADLDQGRQVNIQGVPGDIRLENFQSPPEASSNVSMIVNLNSGSVSRSDDIWAQWNANDDPPGIGDAAYTYQSTMRVYDQNGGGHNLTTYFDPLPDGDPLQPGDGGRVWQFMVTVPPDEDNRDGFDGLDDQGLIQRGWIEFDAAGNVRNYTFADDGGNAINTEDMRISQNGYPRIGLDFLGEGPDPGPPVIQPQEVELNFGLRFSGAEGALAPDPADWTPDALVTTSYSSPSSTLYQSQDGYTAGFLQNISISREGVMTGRYSNGQVLELYALTLTDFNNVWGLRREGGNLFAETRESGPALTGIAGQGRLGTVASNSLELSNVDLATEFVKMISTQKGFQANSKTITTTDTMLDEVIRMKR